MPLPCLPPPSPLRCAQALSCLVAFSTAAAGGRWLPGEGAGCASAWALACAGSALLLGAEALRRLPPRRDLPLAHAAAAATACAAATVLWPLGHLRDDGGDGTGPRALRVTAAAASGLATALYGAEVLRDRARPGQAAPYLATPAGLLKVVEAVLGLLLLGLAAEQGAGAGPEAWRWCLGIYCVSFAVALVLVLGCLWGCGACGACTQDPTNARRALGLHAAAGLVAFGAAAVLWPLYGFRDELGGRARRPPGCGAACGWDRTVLVAVLSALGLLLYGVDLGHSGRLVLLRG